MSSSDWIVVELNGEWFNVYAPIRWDYSVTMKPRKDTIRFKDFKKQTLKR